MTWAGVDVGGPKKGFDLAIVSNDRLENGPCHRASVEDAVLWLTEHSPRVVAVDSPRKAARPGNRSREGERVLVKAGVCNLRYTPDEETMRAHPSDYYGWILNGLAFYDALDAARRYTGWTVIECFPTASWTRLGGKRESKPRARWTSALLPVLGIDNLPSTMNQDARDAIVAAVTARLFEERKTDAFGDIIVPKIGA